MLKSPTFRLFAALTGWLFITPGATAQYSGAAPTSQPAEAAKPTASAPAAKSGPKYLALRYNEDFSYLDGPEGGYTKDLFDPIKNIHLDKDWTLRLGGEVRLRMESETNKTFGARDPTNDTILLYRELLHADLRYRKLFRLFVEGVDARVADRDLPQAPGMENTFDMHQLFADLRVLGEQLPLTLRVGRQDMSYGKERVIGKGDWTNQSRRYDGVKLLYATPKLDIDFFWTKPIAFATKPFSNPWNTHINEGMNRKPDHWREEQQFYGTYATYKGISNHYVEMYFLGLNDKGFLTNANNHMGDLSVYTLGGRAGGTSGGFDYDSELAGQWGKWAGEEVHAWMFATDDGYTFKTVPWSPRLGAGFDYASGDDTPRDGSHDTFNQLFPTGHSVLGYIDLVGRQNILAPNINLTLKPLKNVTAKLFYYHFWLDSNLDALYNAAGSAIRRNVSGSSGKDVGDEMDVTVNWQADVHSSFLFGWSHFWPDSFIHSSGRSQDADLIYLQYQFKF